MPLIPVVGRKSLTARLLVGAIYALLILGAVTMVYPFTLMISTATTGESDWRQFQLVPTYWYSDAALLRKYMLNRQGVGDLAWEFGREDWHLIQDIEPTHIQPLLEMPDAPVQRAAADWQSFLASVDDDLKELHFLDNDQRRFSVLSLRTEYFEWLREKYDGALSRVCDLYEDSAEKWVELGMPPGFTGRWVPDPHDLRHQDWREYVASRNAHEQRLLTPDSQAFNALRREFGNVGGLLAQHRKTLTGDQAARRDAGTLTLADFTWEVLDKYEWGRELKLYQLRTRIPIDYIRLTEAAREPFEAFAGESFPGLAPEFTTTPPHDVSQRAAYMAFIRSKRSTLEHLRMRDPRAMWREYLRDEYGRVEAVNEAHGTEYASLAEADLPSLKVGLAAFRDARDEIKRRFLLGNFREVIGFIVVHGRALINTFIFIFLAITGALTVNPMAAYALSRFRLRYASHILVFVLATMAFPAEVVMIPNFLMVKSFPLGAIVLAGAGALMFMLARGLLRLRIPLGISLVLATVSAGVAAWLLPPALAEWMGREDLNVTLMNTFFALVLPGLAHGFSIFLLKGFFDSLPPELYEAAMLDGAGEITMFTRITMPLCKPVLAVIALGAFTTAYGSFMFAFLTCQDPRMWTLMVFLYQFQQESSVPLVMAALVVSAIPTLLVFVFCQKIILRGIVIPTFK
jgi:multiple sugar transport system permease protein